MPRAVLSIDNDNLYLDKRSDVGLPYIQNKLSIAYDQRKQVICHCAFVPMYVKKYGRVYKIASYPYRANEHKENCIFSDNVSYYAEDGRYYLGSINLLTYSDEPSKKKVILEEREQYAAKNSSVHLELPDEQDEERYKIYKSFSNLMYDIVSDAYTWGFNFVNKGVSRSESTKLKNPTLPLVSNKVMEILTNDIVLPGKQDVKHVIDSYMLHLYCGVILDYEIEDKYVICRSFGTKFYIDIRLWEQASKMLFIKSYKNIIQPPYFYVSLRRENRVIKFWMLPIANSSYFAPVDSNLERSEINALMNDGKVLFKPLLCNDYLTIFRMAYDKLKPLIKAAARPDIILFDDNKIKIIEVVDSGVLDKDDIYRRRLEQKKEYYASLTDPFCYEIWVK